ncbi:MAG: helix-turn-helix domain-containing protein, partial [Desulforhabdus sp.]|nr:helix-turn-helix domain-containing protein [Desulforhabdus sp.]
IFELINHFLEKYNKSYGMRKWIRPIALDMLQSYSFPGNIRELKNLVKKAVVMSEQEILDDFLRSALKGTGRSFEANRQSLGGKCLNDELLKVEKEILKSAMESCKSTRQLAARLGMSQPTVVRKMKKHGLAFQ